MPVGWLPSRHRAGSERCKGSNTCAGWGLFPFPLWIPTLAMGGSSDSGVGMVCGFEVRRLCFTSVDNSSIKIKDTLAFSFLWLSSFKDTRGGLRTKGTSWSRLHRAWTATCADGLGDRLGTRIPLLSSDQGKVGEMKKSSVQGQGTQRNAEFLLCLWHWGLNSRPLTC
jgi:hypothetical protein